VQTRVDEVGDAGLSAHWADLLAARQAALVRRATGRVLFVDPHVVTDTLDDCVHAAVKPIFTGATFVDWSEEPTEDVLGAAIGIVRIDATLGIAHYSNEHDGVTVTAMERREADLPNALHVEVSALGAGDPKSWAIDVTTATPEEIRGDGDRDVRGAAAGKALDALTALQDLACTAVAREITP
jgi:hypothetical protein